MVTKYPARIDTSAELPTVIDNVTPFTADVVNRLRDAILAIEQELGIKPSGTFTTVRARLDWLEEHISDAYGGGGGGLSNLSGDVNGPPSATQVLGIGGRPFSPIQPLPGQSIVWDGYQWKPLLANASFGGDLIGTFNSQTVVGLRNNPISIVPPNDGQTLIWNTLSSQWAPSTNFGSNQIISGSVNTGVVFSTREETSLIDLSGKLMFEALYPPIGVSNLSQGIIYFDGYQNQFLISQNSGPYVPLLSGYVGSAGTFGSASSVPVTTTDAYGRVTSIVDTTIQISESQVTNLSSDLSSINSSLANKVDNTLNIFAGAGLSGGGNLSSDVTIYMPDVGSAGTYGSSTQIPVFTTDGYGRITGVVNTPISGSVGPQGAQGDQGFQGPQGAQGIIGPQGPAGTSANLTITDDTTTNSSFYPVMTSSTSGSVNGVTISSTKLYFNPSTGEITAVDFNSTSDFNLKTNVQSLTNSIEILNQINPVSFNWVDTDATSYGVIAQEIEKVLPELVREIDGTKSVAYIPLIALLIDAVKNLQKEIDDLKNK